MRTSRERSLYSHPVSAITERTSGQVGSLPAKVTVGQAAPICATSLAGPSRSSRAINEACKLAGTALAE